MDEDKSGTVDRLEWLAYLCSGGSEGQGKDYYDFKLRELFDKSDKRKKGSLNMNEFTEFLKLDFKKSMYPIPDSDKWCLDSDFKKCARDCFI